MSTVTYQITSLTILFSTVYSMRKSKETSKLCVKDTCAGNSSVIVKFPVQMASNTENVSIWWRHHGERSFLGYFNKYYVNAKATHILVHCAATSSTTKFVQCEMDRFALFHEKMFFNYPKLFNVEEYTNFMHRLMFPITCLARASNQ